MTFWERYTALCEEKGLKPYVLAVECGCKSNSSAASWRRGSVPKGEILQRIADRLGVTVAYLLGQTNDRSVPSNHIRIPVLGSVPAGVPLDAIEDIRGWEEIPEQLTDGGREHFGLVVDGDSMYPRYLPGDTVIVRKQDQADSGDDCVVYVNGYAATLKQVIYHGDGSMTLQPVNPQYAPRTFSGPELDSVKIAGVVVELRRKIK